MLVENWLVYRPAGLELWTEPPSPLVKDVELVSATGDKIHAWWYPREGSTGAILYLHGNAGNLSWRGNAISILREQLGEPILIIDYPGYGKSGGRPSEAGCYAAAEAAYQWLTETQAVKGENVVLYGESLGGGVAVDLASRLPHRALVLVKTFTSAPDVGQSMLPYMPVRWVMRNRFDSLSKIGRCKQPIFVAHGDADRLIPFEQGQKLYEAAVGKKTFLRLAGADHNDGLPWEFFVALKEFLAESSPAPVQAGT